MRKMIAKEDRSLSARVIECTKLVYAAGPAPYQRARQTAPHVRAGSALAWVGTRLAVVQDDAPALALLDPAKSGAEAFLLPGGGDTKATKLDLEACIRTGDALAAFGSGSTPNRERVVMVEGVRGDPGEWTTSIRQLPSLYAALRAQKTFSGSQLNIEGAVVLGEQVRFFQRGNGKHLDGVEPVDATCDVSLQSLIEHLQAPDRVAPPVFGSVTQFDLGAIDGVRLTFTDATLVGDQILYLAVAEDSPDAVQDGPVAGAVIGVMQASDPETPPRWTCLRDREGRIFTGKAEGIAVQPDVPGRAYVVVDRDDPKVPADLCLVELNGFLVTLGVSAGGRNRE